MTRINAPTGSWAATVVVAFFSQFSFASVALAFEEPPPECPMADEPELAAHLAKLESSKRETCLASLSRAMTIARATASDVPLFDARRSYRCAIGKLPKALCKFDPEPGAAVVSTTEVQDISARITAPAGGGAGTVPAPIAELLTLTAEIAIKRAKQNGLAFLHDRIEDTVCKLELPRIAGESAPSNARVFPATCRLLGDASLEELAADPRRLQQPLVHDLVGVAQHVGWKYLEKATGVRAPGVAAGVRLAVELALRARGRQDAAPAASEARALVNLLLAERCAIKPANCGHAVWGKARAVPLALEAVARFVAENGDRDIATLVAEIVAGPDADVDVQVRASTLAALAVRALALDGRTTKRPDKDAWLAAIMFVLETARESVAKSDAHPFHEVVDRLEDLLEAIADENAAAAISATAQLVLTVIETGEGCKDDHSVERSRGKVLGAAERARCKFPPSLEKATALLTALASYSATYVGEKDGSSEAELRAARKAALEGMIDAATKRSNRHGDVVFSFGMPIGFALGGQHHLHDNPGTDETTFMAPQLEVPLGFGMQKLVGTRRQNGRARPDRKFYWDGAHAFVSALDLGQFLAYDAKGELARPRWDSIFSPGFQVGWVIGSPANSFVIGAEVRYAPTLFAGTSKLSVFDDPRPGGVIRFGLVLAYYVALFDFN